MKRARRVFETKSAAHWPRARDAWPVVYLVCLAFCGLVQASGDGGFALEELAEGVYVHLGAHAELDQPQRADSANLGVIIGARCIAVIDSGGAVKTGRALKSAIARLSDKPVCYVINTHVHFDHVLGNTAFDDPQTRVVGHRNLAEAVAANREFFAEHFMAELNGGDPALVRAPDLLVDDTMELDLGGRVLQLRAVRRAHSTADLTVLDSRSEILWAGDLLFRERMPVLDGSLLGWLSWMETAMSEAYAAVVPGHGPVDHAWPAGAAAQRAYFETLRDDTRAAIREGRFLDEARDSVAVDAPAKWQLPQRAHPLNISRAWRELEWE